jgi:hypothetical protein
MTLHRQGQTEKAKDSLAKARNWAERSRQAKPGTATPVELTTDRFPWTERPALELLEKEAGTLIEGESPSK